MDYIELSISNLGDFDPEIVIANLADLGFESFTESETGIQGYIQEDLYHEITVTQYLKQLQEEHGIEGSFLKIPARNWNAIWESAYEPVTIAGKCRVRAPFHQPEPGILHDIIIEPRMSFGTAHHETTSLMLEMLMDEDVTGKRMLDMGCGTGVIAILACRMGAADVVAIDNDEWAYSNALDNMEKNDAMPVKVIRGEADAIPDAVYDFIVANINRNVLLEDIPCYATHLESHGVLLMSGFYEQDIEQIKAKSESAGLQYEYHKSENNWVGIKFVK
ncbi:MAG: 50S ribosomal protein L11 methyltransferase [bacterium]